MRVITILIIAFLGLVVLNSCTKKRDTKDSLGKYSLNILNSESNANTIYIMPSDSTITKDTTLIKWMRLLKDSIKYDNYLQMQSGEIKQWREKISKLNPNKNGEIEFLRTELDSVKNWSSTSLNLNVFFLINKKEHFFKLIDVDSLDNKWSAYGINPPTNQAEVEQLEKEQRKREANKPYTPYGLYCSNGNWESKYARPETFSNFFVTIKNTTSNDFKKVKFRVTISKKKLYKKTEVFSKIIEKSESIYAGDVVRFEIYELRDFYVGIKITDKDNFDFDVDIIDAKPRPGYEDLPY